METLKGSITILDDDKDILLSAKLYLEQYFDKVVTLSRPLDLIPSLVNHPADVILLDMNYHRGKDDGREGLRLLKEIKDKSNVEVVVMTAYGDLDLAVEATKIGAFDFVLKPWNNDKLRTTLMAALRLSMSNKENAELRKAQDLWQSNQRTVELIGNSQALQSILSTIDQVAKTDANILILGENGTGKEVVAHLIHQASLRSTKPFVKVDLGAIHDQLFESELFGAVKGAYTDLQKDKDGRIVLAHKGTLFLDEIGNLSTSNQVKLLSLLQNRCFQPVGSNKEVPVDIRLISATNADLTTSIKEKSFRQDLYYRIKTIEIWIPPLRDRIEDIPMLANHFLNIFSKKYQKPELTIGSKVMQHLLEYDWPGNVRELEHAIERSVILSTGNHLSTENIIPAAEHRGSRAQNATTLSEVERMHIDRVLSKNNGNISHAAKELGLTRAALYRRIDKYQL